jgi:hypothetical protein
MHRSFFAGIQWAERCGVDEKQAAEKPKFFEGDGLQAVHNCFVVNAALAAEEAIFHQPRLLPQPVKAHRFVSCMYGV